MRAAKKKLLLEYEKLDIERNKFAALQVNFKPFYSVYMRTWTQTVPTTVALTLIPTLLVQMEVQTSKLEDALAELPIGELIKIATESFGYIL